MKSGIFGNSIGSSSWNKPTAWNALKPKLFTNYSSKLSRLNVPKSMIKVFNTVGNVNAINGLVTDIGNLSDCLSGKTHLSVDTVTSYTNLLTKSPLFNSTISDPLKFLPIKQINRQVKLQQKRYDYCKYLTEDNTTEYCRTIQQKAAS